MFRAFEVTLAQVSTKSVLIINTRMDVENVFVCVYVTYVSISIYCTNKIYHLYLLQFITILINGH
jgi:hypothetical protein